MLVSKADGGSTQVFEVWREGDAKVILARMVPIMEDLIADEQFAGHRFAGMDDQCKPS